MIDQTEMYYKMNKCDTKLVRSVLESNGFTCTDGQNWHICWSNGFYRNNANDGLVNHFPNSLEITRKDKLIKNIVAMQTKFGKSEFEVIPDSYVLPEEFADFYSHYHSIKEQMTVHKDYLISNKGKSVGDRRESNQLNNNVWIVKPSAGWQGKGIYITDDITQVPIDEQCVVSRYLTNPLLIRGLKFDLRIYVLVTSFEPWRIYIYQEGLVRFASEQYKDSDFDNRYIHLTNYSINKKNEKFVQSNDFNSEESNKWSFALLTKHLEAIGVNMSLLWSRIYDIILKTFIACEPKIIDACKKIPNYKHNSFEVFGFDVMVDSDCRPWILEANLSPSFATDSILDYVIKSNLLKDTVNLLFMKKNEKKKFVSKEDIKLKWNAKSRVHGEFSYSQSPEKTKNISAAPNIDNSRKHFYDSLVARNKQLFNIDTILNDYKDWKEVDNIVPELQNLSYRVREMLKTAILEDQRKGYFVRIYPSYQSDKYDRFFIEPRSLNKLQHKYLYQINETKEDDEDGTISSEDESHLENDSPAVPLIKGSNINERIKSMGMDPTARHTQRDDTKEV